MDQNGYVYADNAATTRVCEEALEAMKPYFSEFYGNPSSIYSFANKPREALAAAREKLERDSAHPEYILTKWGVGYYFAL